MSKLVSRSSRPQKSHNDQRYLIPHIEGEVEKIQDANEQLEDLELIGSDVESVDLNDDEQPIEIDVKSLTLRASNDIQYVRQMSDDLPEIVNEIMIAQTVGFAMFGTDVSRNGSIDLMAFATPNKIYVFNAHDQQIVTSGLKPLLESPDLQKVMFTARKPVDALFSHYKIDAETVVDLRVMYHHLEKKLFVNGQTSSRPLDRLVTLERFVLKFFSIQLPSLDRPFNFKHMSVSVQNLIRLKTIFLRESFGLLLNLMTADFYYANRRCVRSLRTTKGLEYQTLESDEVELELMDNCATDHEQEERPVLTLPVLRPMKFGSKVHLIRKNHFTQLKSNVNEVMSDSEKSSSSSTSTSR